VSGRMDEPETVGRIYTATAPHGFTQYTDGEGDFLTFGEVRDEAERTVHGFVACLATPPGGVGLTAEQALDLADRLRTAALAGRRAS
jgi:hypothetical protein